MAQLQLNVDSSSARGETWGLLLLLCAGVFVWPAFVQVLRMLSQSPWAHEYICLVLLQSPATLDLYSVSAPPPLKDPWASECNQTPHSGPRSLEVSTLTGSGFPCQFPSTTRSFSDEAWAVYEFQVLVWTLGSDSRPRVLFCVHHINKNWVWALLKSFWTDELCIHTYRWLVWCNLSPLNSHKK